MVQLFKNLAAFQQECPTIHKGTQGYGYTYADLPEILNVINPILKKNNLGFTQLILENTIKTIIFETKNGESIESIISIPQNVSLKGMNEFQILGSAITYLRRYALSSALGIVTDKDTDASGEQQKKNPAPKPVQKPNLEVSSPSYTNALNAYKKDKEKTKQTILNTYANGPEIIKSFENG